ncbi:conserved hypothetical protein [Neospora caninum Liverpool]|nr:conserved hypothetical protein [Neospora caninum Liverpool]CBZ54512.1 conserved hypothetical protein [Neospora caninum Liverpool]|eukprot:XP_003884542.1 conserved hypothetical protein [Neospora caninum Liverpool]
MLTEDPHLASAARGGLFLVHNRLPFLSCVNGVKRDRKAIGLSVGSGAARHPWGECQRPEEAAAKQTTAVSGIQCEGRSPHGGRRCSLLSQATAARGRPRSTGTTTGFAPPVSSSSSGVSSVCSASTAPPVYLLASVAGTGSYTSDSPILRQLGEAGDHGDQKPQLAHASFQCLQHAARATPGTLSLVHTPQIAPETGSRDGEFHGCASVHQPAAFSHKRVQSVHCGSPFPDAVLTRHPERTADIVHYSSHPRQLPGVSAGASAVSLAAGAFRADRMEHQQPPQTPWIGANLPLSKQLRCQTLPVDCLQPGCVRGAGEQEHHVREAGGQLSGTHVGSGPAGFLNTTTEKGKSRQSHSSGDLCSATPATSAPAAVSLSATSVAPAFRSASVSHLHSLSPISFGSEGILQWRAKRPAARELPADALLELSSVGSECGDTANGFH